ncbi:hypothetical protein [Pseudobacteriovorax antillogorgiicola]|uniref:Uncharacterized protein n=1 Tax=Pseudobacteriovorax antillogorgiicola TaxID=1513793 RepID=A0A1Y6CFK2_9BACT|nr:hypothetical protein [Pseudobacteriovorax antillogorgiicola]TCS51746.1 hypothetical protein EDD56_110131 [Pseudobacteriovorax antillogorgiicola]SMF49675.1 hypothetical protein SAMN06296036_115100 [Pseudobacteriovorax antillogorgiicola]
MKILIPLILISLIVGNCKEDSDDSGGGVAVLSSDSSRVVFQVDPGANQEVAAPAESSFAGTVVQFPAGTFSESFQLTLQEGISLSNNELQRIFELDAELTVTAAGPAVELKPDTLVGVSAPFNLSIPKPTEDGSNLAVLYRGINELGNWDWGLLGSDAIQDQGTQVSFSSSYLGRFQAVYLSAAVAESLGLSDAGSGPWYGYEFDLYSDFQNPTETGPDLVYGAFSGDKGVVSKFQINGVDLVPLPGYSFGDLRTTVAANVFDESDITKAGPWVFTPSFDYGVMLEAKTGEAVFNTRILQRVPSTAIPTEAVTWEAMVGSYQGYSVQMTSSGVDAKVGTAFVDSVELSYADGTVSLSGTFGQKGLVATLSPNTNTPIAQALGFIEGTSDIEGTSLKTFGFVSPDQKALALVLCPAESCPVGDGTGSYSGQTLQLALFVIED